MRVQAPDAAVAGSTGCAGVDREVSADGAKVSNWFLWWRGGGALVVGLLLILLEQLLEVLPVLGSEVLGALAFVLLILAGLNVILKFGHLLGHNQVGVWVIVEVVLFESLQSLAGSTLSGGDVQDTLLLCILYAVGLATRHRCYF